MSIINYKKGRISDADYLKQGNIELDEMYRRKYDNLVDTFLKANLDESFRINVDLFEDAYMNILRNLLLYKNYSNQLNDSMTDFFKAVEDRMEKEKKLSVINVNENTITKNYLSKVDVSKDTVTNAVDEKKKALEEVAKARYAEETLKSFMENIQVSLDSTSEELRHDYSLITTLYSELKGFTVNRLDEESVENFVNELPYGLLKDSEYFYDELKETIFYEITLITDIFDDIDAISFEQLTDEQLQKIVKAYDKYTRIMKAINVKYEVLRRSYADASNKSLEDRKSKKAHLNNVHSYKRVISYVNRYIDLVYANKLDTLSEESIEAIDQSLGSLYNSELVDESAKYVSELYLKDYLLNAEEYNYLSSSILR